MDRVLRPNILVVDNDDPDRELLIRSIRNAFADAIVYGVNSPEQALHFASNNKLDIAFLDYRMPEQDGVSLMSALRLSQPKASYVLVTNLADEGEVARAFKQGAVDYLPKRHLDRQTVQSTIVRILNTRRLNSEIDDYYEDIQMITHAVALEMPDPIGRIQRSLTTIEGLLGQTNERLCKEIIAIRESCDVLTDINSLVSTQVRSDYSLKFSEVDLRQSFAEALALVSDQVSKSEALVRIEDLPFVWGNGRQLTTVFKHLLENAVKYRSQRRLVVGISSKLKNDGTIEVRVKDNGIGIEKSQTSRIFEAFHRLHHGAHQGAGVGLAICRRVVMRHGGSIWCESVPGRGSEFCLTLHRTPLLLDSESKGPVANHS